MVSKKVVISTGGTGGHVFPAHALAHQLCRSDVEVLFVGGGLLNNQFLEGSNVPYKNISAGTFRGGIFRMFQTCGKILKGVKESCDIIKYFSPDAVVGFGSYYTLPVILASKIRRVPLVLHEGNSIPGKVTRYFSRFACFTGVHLPITTSYLKNSVEVGMPLRHGYERALTSRDGAFKYFELDPEVFTFLVFGGSQGALRLNSLFSGAVLEVLDNFKKFQIIHFTGSVGVAEETINFYNSLGIRSCVKAFEDRMDLAWACGDMVVSRAGALSIAEQLEFEVPGILVPYPYATDRHQEYNADFMVDVGGAVKLLEEDCRGHGLERAIVDLLKGNKLKNMKDKMIKYKKKLCRRDLCSIVREIIGAK